MSELEYYSWPEPTALKSTTDRNQTVRLHGLCTVCQRWVDKADVLISDDLFYDSLYPCYSTERKHYRSSLELAVSSEKGCHLCSILWDQLQANASSLESLRLLESHLQAAFMRTLGMVPHSYALRVKEKQCGLLDADLILYYPPKHHGLGDSKEPWSLLKSRFMNKAPTDIAPLKMHTVPCLCIPYVDRQTLKC